MLPTINEEAISEAVAELTFYEVPAMVHTEIQRQNAKFGVCDHDPAKMVLIMTEEDGEVARAILEHDYGHAEEELIQSISLRIRLIEKLRRM